HHLGETIVRHHTVPLGASVDRDAPAGGPLVRNNGNRGLLEGGITVSTISPFTTDLDVASAAEISDTLRHLLADVLVLFVKTKSFHWHIGGRHFRSDHMLLDEHATQIFSMVDDIAEPIRKVGGTAIRSVGDVARNQRLADHDAADCSATDMLQELLDDNRRLRTFLRHAHGLCDRHRDLATASLIENWIDETERRVWFITET